MIEIKDLNKAYGKSIVLDDINLKVDKGFVYALLGKNGVGKTTQSIYLAYPCKNSANFESHVMTTSNHRVLILISEFHFHRKLKKVRQV